MTEQTGKAVAAADEQGSAREVRPFFETLREVRKGACLDDLAKELNKLVQAVVETGRGGELTLKLKFEPTGANESNPLMISDDITVKMPKAKKGGTIMYPDKHCNLTRHDPRQPELPGLAVAGKERAFATE